MKSIFVDTNIIIDFTKGHDSYLKKLLKLQQNQKLELCINPIIITEFFTDKNLQNSSKLKQAKDFFSLFRSITIDDQIGFTTANLLRTYQLTLGDSLIAATCIIHHLSLATKNTKHFRLIKELTFYITPTSP